MRWLLITFVLLSCGCQTPKKLASPASLVPAQKPPPKKLEDRILGTWTATLGKEEIRVTYAKDHSYSERMGAAGFPSGYLETSGTWSFYLGDRLELTPEHRENHVLASDKRERARIKAYEKVMDEGAWKPFPTPIQFIDDATFTAGDFHDVKTVYKRVSPPGARTSD